MKHEPRFRLEHEDYRDWFVNLLLTIVLVGLAIEGWRAFLNR